MVEKIRLHELLPFHEYAFLMLGSIFVLALAGIGLSEVVNRLHLPDFRRRRSRPARPLGFRALSAGDARQTARAGGDDNPHSKRRDRLASLPRRK